MNPVRRSLPLWKEEVSFRSADERYVMRRQFGKFMVLTSFGMFAGNMWILARSWTRRLARRPAPPELAVATLDELAVGEVKLFMYPTAADPCLLVRLDDGTFAAFSQKCTHLSCAVIYEKQTGRLACPCHQGYFSARTGEVLQGPPPRPLLRVGLEQRGHQLFAVGVMETAGG